MPYKKLSISVVFFLAVLTLTVRTIDIYASEEFVICEPVEETILEAELAEEMSYTDLNGDA